MPACLALLASLESSEAGVDLACEALAKKGPDWPARVKQGEAQVCLAGRASQIWPVALLVSLVSQTSQTACEVLTKQVTILSALAGNAAG